MKTYTLGQNKLLVKKEPVEEKPKSGLYISPPKDESVAKGIITHEGKSDLGHLVGKTVYFNKYLCVNVIDKDHCVLKIEDALVFEENK